MEKIIELLNEYEWYTDIPTWTLSWANEPLYWWWTAYASAYLIPSKKYWFIERLVKNDKIDFDIANSDISKDIVLWREPDFADFMVYRRFLDEEKVLMLLSIQDNPIEFLCSVLN